MSTDPTPSDHINGTDQSKVEWERLSSIWPKICADLEKRVKKGDRETVLALAKLFPASRYPPAKKDESHCVWCHVTYDRRSPGSCRVEHKLEDYTRESKWHEPNGGGMGSFWSVKCIVCGKKFEAESSDVASPPKDMVEGFCWDGQHNDNPYERTENEQKLDFDECSLCQNLRDKAEKETEEWKAYF